MKERDVPGAFIIVLREVIEAGLIIGIVLAATRAMPRRLSYIGAGIFAGLLGAGCVAAAAGALSNMMAGAGQEVFNASVLGTAVVMLAWHNIWMARHGRQLSENAQKLGGAILAGARTMAALTIAVAVTVLREGSEVVLFLYGLILTSRETGIGLLLGGALGLVSGALISTLTYMGLAVIPPRYLFKVTSILIGFMAAGMAAQSVAFLEQAGIVTTLGDTAWNTAWLLGDDSIVGRVLHTLTGYTDRPTQLQLLVYLVTHVAIFGLMWRLAPAAERPELATN